MYKPVYGATTCVQRLNAYELTMKRIGQMAHTDAMSFPTVLPVPQQCEVRLPEEDWTGTADPVQRRKMQNRLHQRAWRRRQARERKSQSIIITQDMEQQNMLQQSSKCIAGYAWVKVHDLVHFEQMMYQQYLLGSPRADLLLTLIKFNVFRALLNNTRTLGFTLEWVEGDDAISPFYKPGCNINADNLVGASDCPSHLQPTELQRVLEHHPWIDLFPVPQMRDNILRRGSSFDDGLLCLDIVELCGGLNEHSGLFVWGEPWDQRNWEVGEGFVQNWAWVIEGCTELRAATNYWRNKRGQKSLFQYDT